MATIKKFRIDRNWSVRNGREYGKAFYDVSVGEKYDLINFIINELDIDISWCESIGIKCGTSKESINKIVNEYAKTIKNQDIKDYKEFLKAGDKYGWD